MTAKEWLNRGRYLDKEINQLLEDQQNALNLACGTAVSYGGEKVQTSKQNATEQKFIAYADYSAEIDNRIDQLYDIKTEIKAVINKLDDPLLRALLIARYVNIKTWEQIAEDLNYDLRWVYRLHDKALHAIESHYKSVI